MEFDLAGLLVLRALEFLVFITLILSLVLFVTWWDEWWRWKSVTILAQKLSIHELQESWRSWHSRATWSVNHHAGDLGLMLIVHFSIGIFRNLCHVLEVQKATEGICLRLMMHHLQGLSVLVALTVHRTSLDQHQLLLVVMIGLRVVYWILFRVGKVCLMLVIHMVALLVMLHHHLLIFKIFLMPFWGKSGDHGFAVVVLRSVNILWLYLVVFFTGIWHGYGLWFGCDCWPVESHFLSLFELGVEWIYSRGLLLSTKCTCLLGLAISLRI